MKNLIKLILPIGIVILGCKDAPEEIVESLRPVRYQKIESISKNNQRIFTGIAKPGIESKLSFKIAGTISKLYAKLGQKVVKGSLIAVLDNSDYLLQYEEADAGVKNADALEKSAKSNYERISVLYENQNVSLAEFESAKASYDSSKANEKAMKQRRKLAESQISYTRLKSPIEGIISSVFVEENENVGAGHAIIIVTSNKKLEVEVSVPDLYISQISDNDEVQVVFSAFKEKSYKAIVSEVGFASGYQTTYPVILQLTDSDDDIRPGMTAEVIFELSDRTVFPKIYVPAKSVGEDQENRFVYLVEPLGNNQAKVNKQIVEIGELTEFGIEIIDGLNNGDLLVTAGVSKINDGMTVKLLP